MALIRVQTSAKATDIAKLLPLNKCRCHILPFRVWRCPYLTVTLTLP